LDLDVKLKTWCGITGSWEPIVFFSSDWLWHVHWVVFQWISLISFGFRVYKTAAGESSCQLAAVVS